jgi:HPt (histidine-containing phosphotransfer) domain-containing protein
MTHDADFEAHFAALRERFRAGLGSYRDRLVEARNALAAGKETMRPLKGVAHELAGSAETFGFAEIGAVAASLEEAVDQVLAGSAEPLAVIAPLRGLIREVELSL